MVNVNGLLRSVAPLAVNTSCSVMCTVVRLPSAEVISNPRWCDTTVIEKPQTSETSKGAIVSSKDSLAGLSAYAGAAAASRLAARASGAAPAVTARVDPIVDGLPSFSLDYSPSQ